MGTNKKNSKTEPSDMKETGFTFNSAESDFSEQPDSGGRIGGIRGKQEYGIVGGIADEDEGSSEDEFDGPADVNAEEVGLSEFAERAVLPLDEVAGAGILRNGSSKHGHSKRS